MRLLKLFLTKFIWKDNDSQQYIDEKFDKITIANLFRQIKVSGMAFHAFSVFSSALHVITANTQSKSLNSKSLLSSMNFCFHIELNWKSINFTFIPSELSHFKLSKLRVSSDVESG